MSREILNSVAERLLDPSRNNNLVNFRDRRVSTAEIVLPEFDTLLQRCESEHCFEVFDPGNQDTELGEASQCLLHQDTSKNRRLTREEYIRRYSRRIRGEQVLIYAQTPNPLTAVRNIAKKAQMIQSESGINVTYIALGFLRYRDTNNEFYRAPLLLIHIDIIASSVRNPVRIRICDDDVIVNPTLNHKLRRDFQDSLPEYNEENTLNDYCNGVAEKFACRGWDVIRECKIGLFSFQKINMYEDLMRNADIILKNDNIMRILANIRRATPNQADVLYGVSNNNNVVNNSEKLLELHSVVEADSSQIDAILMSKCGESFVLQGPPGTGKSQTITNIIAELMYNDKKVLFVSEKQAALNVVFEKLKSVGLGDYCLELHSHKANKRTVIEELCRILNTNTQNSSCDDKENEREYREILNKVDTYVASLHEKRNPINRSLYELIELYYSKMECQDIACNIGTINKKGQNELNHAIDLLEQYTRYIHVIGEDFRKHPWYGYKYSNIGNKETVLNDLELIQNSFKTLLNITCRLQQQYDIHEQVNFFRTKKLQMLLDYLGRTDVITPSVLSRDGYNRIYQRVKEMKRDSEEIMKDKKELLKTFNPGIFTIPNIEDKYRVLKDNFKSSSSRHKFLFWGKNENYRRYLHDNLEQYLIEKTELGYDSAVNYMRQLYNLQSKINGYNNRYNYNEMSRYLGSCYNGYETDWGRVLTELSSLKLFIDESESLFGNIPRMNYENFKRNQNSFQQNSQELHEEIYNIINTIERISPQFSKEQLDLDNCSYGECITKLGRYLSARDNFEDWIRFVRLLEEIKSADLKDFIAHILNTNPRPENIVDLYMKCFYKKWVDEILSSEPVFTRFERIRHEQNVKNFIETDDNQYKINQKLISSKLSKIKPNPGHCIPGSPVAVLNIENNRRRRQMPIRRLLSETGSVVQKIKPCFLMSPLSVSTYLDPEIISFDVVIFDEASQIFTEDALGAIYRGKQIIVVGDPQQMPPSNFFKSTIDSDDDEDNDNLEYNNFESILQTCCTFRTKQLNWHYRSKFEQLIAFSNKNFYNYHLVTFPSPYSSQIDGTGVDYYFANGTYNRNSRTNLIEAQYIVELVYRHFREFPNRSLGVVAFSITQQNLIDQLLEQRRAADPSFENYFRADNFFIKNLETVQGDERDTIIFSVAYARDENGIFRQNFGPLNCQGGERRLNVAVTRAKINVKLVASIHYSDINISTTASQGVRLLREYLEYAETGNLVSNCPQIAQNEEMSYFLQDIREFLVENGFTVDTHIGCSEHKTDLAVRHPDSHNYVLAIECDGEIYHIQKNARDRDKLRKKILENMGWRYYRIWSTEWYKNNPREKKSLLEAVQNAIQDANESITDIPYSSSVINSYELSHSNLEPDNSDCSQPVSEPPQIDNNDSEDSQSTFPIYRQLDALSVINSHGSFINAIRAILEIEAPLSIDFLLGRININRERFSRYMNECENNGIVMRNGFLYLNDSHVEFRIPGYRRRIEYISIEELAEGFRTLIRQNIFVPQNNLYRRMTELLGFGRTGHVMSTRYDEALDFLINNHIIERRDNGYTSI